MFLPAEIIPVLMHFRPAFDERTYQKVVELLIGTMLARGRRTVTAALRAVGKGHERQWSKYHHVLNRAQWSGVVVSRLLLELIVATFVSSGAIVTVAVDETLERRWGPQIRQCGHWRDSRSSSKGLHVSSRGLRWLVFAVVVRVPWTEYAVALPFLSVLLTTPKVSAKLGKRHKTVAQVTGQVVIWLRRTLAGYPLHLVGDGAYAVIELGLRCQRCQVTLIAPLRLDARLFEPPVRPQTKGRGRPPLSLEVLSGAKERIVAELCRQLAHTEGKAQRRVLAVGDEQPDGEAEEGAAEALQLVGGALPPAGNGAASGPSVFVEQTERAPNRADELLALYRQVIATLGEYSQLTGMFTHTLPARRALETMSETLQANRRRTTPQ